MKFGRYRLIERIGEGGMADVYRAVVSGPKGFQRQLAIKRIHTLFARELDFINMLGTEARVTAMLNHPAIVQVYEFGHAGDELYLAMELAEGADLGRLLAAAAERDVPMPPGVACYVVSQLADALAYAHALVDGEGRPLHIIHRDVTPSNIVLSHVGGVKLLDFGIARAASHLRSERTRTGVLKGKISYLSPEQIDGQEIDHRSDQFALGIVLYECLTLGKPFKGVLREVEITKPSLKRPELDPELDAIALKMLSLSPNDRFATCAEVVTALAPLTRRLGGDALALRDWLTAVGPLPSTAQPIPEDAPEATQAESMAPQPTVASQPQALQARLANGSVTGGSGEIGVLATGELPKSKRSLWRVLVLGLGVATLVMLWFLPGVRRGAPEGPTLQPAPAGATTTAGAATAANQPAANGANGPATGGANGLAGGANAAAGAPPATAVNGSANAAANAPATTAPSVQPTADEAATMRPARPAQVRLTLSGAPAGAEVLVDNQLVGQLPLDVRLPAGAGERHLAVRKSGYKPWARTIAGDVDVSLRATLSKASPAHGHGRAGRDGDDDNAPVVRNPFGR